MGNKEHCVFYFKHTEDEWFYCPKKHKEIVAPSAGWVEAFGYSNGKPIYMYREYELKSDKTPDLTKPPKRTTDKNPYKAWYVEVFGANLRKPAETQEEKILSKLLTL